MTHRFAPTGKAWSPPPLGKWGAFSFDMSTGLLSQSTTSSPSDQRSMCGVKAVLNIVADRNGQRTCVWNLKVHLWDALPIIHPYTVSAPMRRASVLPPTKLCKASLRLLCSGERGELLDGKGSAVGGNWVSEEPECSKWRVAAMWSSFRW